MDTQHACLSKMVLEGELLPFIEAKISTAFFPDSRHVVIWGMVLEHYKKHGKPPDETVIHKAYPTYAFTPYPEPTAYYLNQLQQDRKKVILTQGLQLFGDRLQQEEGPNIGDDLEVIMRRAMSNAHHEISQGRDTDFFLSHDRILARMEERKHNPGLLRGITTGFPGIDTLTGGLQPEQLICLVGTSKAGKSSVVLRMAYNGHRNGNPVLFVTFEMSTEEQEDRLISLVSGVGLTKVLTGTFDHLEEQKIKKAMGLRKDMSGFTITSDVASAITVSGVQAKIQQYQPALVIIDGMYLMDDEAGNAKGTPQALTSLTRGFKRLAQTMRLPIVVTTQAMLYRAKKGLNLDSIGYSSSFAQDSDVVMGVEQDEHVPMVSHFKVLASRSSPRGEAVIRFDWGQGLVEELDRQTWEQMQTSHLTSAGAGRPASGLQQHWQAGQAVSNGP